jgi:hypothetical protein
MELKCTIKRIGQRPTVLAVRPEALHQKNTPERGSEDGVVTHLARAILSVPTDYEQRRIGFA